MLTRLLVAIISEYTHTPNHRVVHLKLIQCYMSIISIKLVKNLLSELLLSIQQSSRTVGTIGVAGLIKESFPLS